MGIFLVQHAKFSVIKKFRTNNFNYNRQLSKLLLHSNHVYAIKLKMFMS